MLSCRWCRVYYRRSNGLRAMGYNARNDEIRDNVTRMRGEWEAQRGALGAPLQCNTIGQRLFVVLAQDRSRAHIKAPLARYQLRQLGDRDGPGLAREAT